MSEQSGFFAGEKDVPPYEMPGSRARQQARLDARSAELLTRIYLSCRIDYQLLYYRAKTTDYEANADLMFRLGALVMTISSLLAALATLSDARPEVRLATALLPALAALIASFRQLYQWDRQAALYRDTVLGLERARLLLPDQDALDDRTALDIYPQLVERSESVFQGEVNQWGKIALGSVEGEEGTQDPLRAFAEEYQLDVFTEEGQVDEERLALVRDILTAARGSTASLAALTLDQPPGQITARASNAEEDEDDNLSDIQG